MGTGTYTSMGSGGGIRPMRMIGGYDLKIAIGSFTFSSTYASGGESLPATSMGLQKVMSCVFSPSLSAVHALNANKALFACYDYTNEKVIALGASAQAAADGSGAGGMSEVAVPTDLSGFTVRFIAIGY